jgi:hypothetical protein
VNRKCTIVATPYRIKEMITRIPPLVYLLLPFLIVFCGNEQCGCAEYATQLKASLSSPTPSITAGDEALLVWSVSGKGEIDDIYIMPEVGTLKGLSGTVKVRPLSTTTYTLTAVDSDYYNEDAHSSATITVKSKTGATLPPDTRNISFSGYPTEIMRGQSAKLQWHAEGCDSATITGIGGAGIFGSAYVTPFVTTTYILVATQKGLPDATRTVTIIVNDPNPSPTYVPPTHVPGSQFGEGYIPPSPSPSPSPTPPPTSTHPPHRD